MSVQDVNLRQTNLWQDGFRQQNQGGQQKQMEINQSEYKQRQHEQSGNPSRQRDQGGVQRSNQSGQVSKTPTSPKDARKIKQVATGE